MRRTTSLRSVRAAAAASVLLLVLAGCGGDETETTGGEQSAGETSSAPVEPSEEADAGYSQADLLAAMKAAVAQNRSAHFTMEISGGPGALTAEGDMVYAAGGPQMAMTMTGSGLGEGEMDMRLVDGKFYMSVPGMTPEGKFVVFDPAEPGSPFAGSLGSLTQMDPLSTFDAFEAGLRKVEYVGEETVDGETLHHYVLTVDTEAATKAQGQEMPAGMPETITYDLWLDDQDLMRRVEFTMMPEAAMVMELSAWGEPVTVEAPPRKDVIRPPGG